MRHDGLTHSNLVPSTLMPHGMAAPNVKNLGSRGGKTYTTRSGTVRYGGGGGSGSLAWETPTGSSILTAEARFPGGRMTIMEVGGEYLWGTEQARGGTAKSLAEAKSAAEKYVQKLPKSSPKSPTKPVWEGQKPNSIITASIKHPNGREYVIRKASDGKFHYGSQQSKYGTARSLEAAKAAVMREAANDENPKPWRK